MRRVGYNAMIHGAFLVLPLWGETGKCTKHVCRSLSSLWWSPLPPNQVTRWALHEGCNTYVRMAACLTSI